MQEVREFRYHFSPQEVIAALKATHTSSIGIQAIPPGSKVEVGKDGIMVSHSKVITIGQQTKGDTD